MGQKINPIGLRLGINRTWDSRWFAGKNEYAKLLHEDIRIREVLMKELKQAAVARIVIERPHKKCRVSIHSARPGVVIGKKGADIDKLKKKVAEIEAEQMRKVYKKERDQLKDDIVQRLLPQAFLKHKVTYALLLDDMIIVDASSARQAEDLLSTMREVTGSLPVRPVSVKLAPTATFTEWVRSNAASNGLYLRDECELRDTHEDGGIVQCKRQDLAGEEVQNHLAAGKLVTKLAMAWEDKLSFVLDDKMAIKRIRFEDLLQEQAEQDGGDDAAGVAVASLAIMGGTFAEFVPALLEALGGEDVPEGI